MIGSHPPSDNPEHSLDCTFPIECRLCGLPTVRALVCFHGHEVGRCSHCGSGAVLNAVPVDSQELDEATARYEQELNPQKAERCFGLMDRRMNGLEIRSVLDIGCGEGAFLDLALKVGLRTAGVEMSRRAADVALRKGHEIFVGSILDNPIPNDARFDAVTIWDTLEHLERPGQVLRLSRDLLKPGGILIAITPRMASVYDRFGVTLHRLTRGRFDQLLRMCWSDHHQFRFHPEGIALVLRGLGFEAVRVEPMLFLSLGAESYAGGLLLPAWTRWRWLDRLISRTGVATARLLGLHNKILIMARTRNPDAER